MADKTKAQLETENEELNDKVDELTEKLNEKFDATHYELEVQRLNSKLEKEQSEHAALKVKVRDERIERETLENDRREREIRELAEFGITTQQDEHTRFRVLAKAPTGQRDIFGDTTSEVVDLGVGFNDYTGGVFVPLSIFIEVGQSIGMLTKDQADSLNTELSNTKAKVEFAGNNAKELTSGIEKLVDKFFANLDSIVDGGGIDRSNDESTESSDDENLGQAPDADLGSESTRIPDGADNPKSDSGNETPSGGFFSNLK